MWHRSAYPIISQLRLLVSHKLVVKGQARYVARIMAHADPASARKRTTRRRISLWFESSNRPSVSGARSKVASRSGRKPQVGHTFGCCSSSYSSATAHRRPSFARLIDPTDLFGSGRARKVSSGITASPLKKRTAFTSNSTKRKPYESCHWDSLCT